MLKYNINAFVIAEEILGQSISQIAVSLAVAPKMSIIRGLYWAGLLHDNSKLKLSEAGELMQKRLDDGEPLDRRSSATAPLGGEAHAEPAVRGEDLGEVGVDTAEPRVLGDVEGRRGLTRDPAGLVGQCLQLRGEREVHIR